MIFPELTDTSRGLWLRPWLTPGPVPPNVELCLEWTALPDRTVGSFDRIYWQEPGYFQGDRKAVCAALAARLAPAGSLTIQTRLSPSTRLRGRPARETQAAADYLNAFHALLEPGAAPAVGQPVWEKWLAAAGLEIASFATEDIETELGYRPEHTPADQLRLRALLQQAPAPARQRLTPTVADARILFHVYQATIICRLKAHE
ncbi:MAG: hypothetical protein KDE04_19370 [Anaerolineales bacterium]|nr:hypothetical protein [Anaerolineales bacterium]